MAAYSYTNLDERNPKRVFRDLIRARQLLLDLVWKDLRVRYRYALLGFLWAVLEPVALMSILTFVFSYVLASKVALGVPSDGPPFALFLLSGIIFWQFFATGITAATMSLVDNQHLIRKVHFAREVVPLASIGYPLFNLAIGFIVFTLIHVVLGGAVSVAWLWILPLALIQIILLCGLGLLLSAGHVRFRDIGYITQVAVVFGFYASPVLYSLSLVRDNLPAWAYWLYCINPMAGLLPSIRQVLFEGRAPDIALIWWPALLSCMLLVLGVMVFRRNAPTFSDHL